MNLYDELRGVTPPKPMKAERRLVVNLGLIADAAEIERERVRAKNRAYRESIKDDPERLAAIKAYHEAWRASNAERVRAARKRWIAANIEAWRKYQREWHRAKRERRA